MTEIGTAKGGLVLGGGHHEAGFKYTQFDVVNRCPCGHSEEEAICTSAGQRWGWRTKLGGLHVSVPNAAGPPGKAGSELGADQEGLSVT